MADLLEKKEVIVERLFSTQDSEGNLEEQLILPLDSFFGKSALVILGDPGSGKTTSFEQAAKTEDNAKYAKVSDFLSLRIDRFRDKVLYLDALDEMRSHSEDGRTIFDQLQTRLDELGCPFFRLSCRAADWYGTYDQKRLSNISPDKKITILKIEPLGESEISKIVGSRGVDPKQFIDESKNREIYDILENPQTLKMMLDVVGDGSWPDTRGELYKKAIEILVKERNEDHRRVKRLKFSNDDLLNAAGYIFAVILCGGAQGVALDEVASNNTHFDLNILNVNSRELHAEAARRLLFRSAGSEKSEPVHRTIAEYLSARYMCKRIHEGLPLKRLLALITGYDGGTLSELRGLYSWFACMCKEHTKTLLHIDPFSVVLQGDVSLLNPTSIGILIERLNDFGSINPWLISASWDSKKFGALSSPEIEPLFRKILDDQKQHPIKLRCVIDALKYGHPLPSLGDRLLAVVRSGESEISLQESALEAFGNICPNRTHDLVSILNEINIGTIKDPYCSMRGLLLDLLYPLEISPDDVLAYIVKPPKSYVGSYSMWIKYKWLPSTPESDIPKILNGIVDSNLDVYKTMPYPFSDFLGELLLKGLSLHGENGNTAMIYNWLWLARDRHGVFKLDGKHRKAIREWIIKHPDQYRKIYEYWLKMTKPEQLNKQIFRLHERLCRVEYPQGFAQWLLNLSTEYKNDVIADFIFREAVQMRTIWNRSDSPTVDELFQFVANNQRFNNAWQLELYCEIQQWRQENIQRSKLETKKKEAERIERVGQYTKLINPIRSGKHIGVLSELAEIYLGHFYNVDNELEPRQRVESVSNAECADAAIEGFLAVLETPPSKAPDVSQIARSKAKSQTWNLSSIVIAAMEILVQRNIDIVNSNSDNVLSTALAYHYASDSGKDRKWVSEIIQKRPKLTSATLKTYWEILLKHKCDHIHGIYDLPREEDLVPIARDISLDILINYPNCKTKHLKCLLWAALLYSDKSELLVVAENTLGKRNIVRNLKRVIWYATAFVLNTPGFSKKIIRYIGIDQERAAMLLSFLRPSWPEEIDLPIPELSVSILETLILICGRAFQLSDKKDRFPFNDNLSAIKGMIDKLSGYTTNDAERALDKLINNPSLVSWRKSLLYAKENQIRNRREKVFIYPEIKQVVETINGRAPANPSDLQALVVDHLLAIKDDIQYGSTDGYKAFWNTDPHTRLTSPRHENLCRDRLLERLRHRLAPLGIAAEREGNYSRNKRADIKVLYMSNMNLPVEIKRHYHSELWTAPTAQLQKLYSQDPATGGRGIYLVFWFGISPDRGIPTPPSDIAIPHNSKQLESALRKTILPKDQAKIEVMVIDCSDRKSSFIS